MGTWTERTRQRGASRLASLRQRRQRWLEVRQARRALFSRPTPISDRLRVAAAFHKLVDYLALSVLLLLGTRLLWRLFSANPPHIPDLLWDISQPVVQWVLPLSIQTRLPPPGRLDLAAIIALMIWLLLARIAHRAFHLLAAARAQPGP